MGIEGDGSKEGQRVKQNQHRFPKPHHHPPFISLHRENGSSVSFCLPRVLLGQIIETGWFTPFFRQFHFQLLLHKQHAAVWGLQRLQGNIDFPTITLKQFDPTFSEGFYKTYILRDKPDLTDDF